MANIISDMQKTLPTLFYRIPCTCAYLDRRLEHERGLSWAEVVLQASTCSEETETDRSSYSVHPPWDRTSPLALSAASTDKLNFIYLFYFLIHCLNHENRLNKQENTLHKQKYKAI